MFIVHDSMTGGTKSLHNHSQATPNTPGRKLPFTLRKLANALAGFASQCLGPTEPRKERLIKLGAQHEKWGKREQKISAIISSRLRGLWCYGTDFAFGSPSSWCWGGESATWCSLRRKGREWLGQWTEVLLHFCKIQDSGNMGQLD